MEFGESNLRAGVAASSGGAGERGPDRPEEWQEDTGL